ncbi:MAG: hypothetical protein KGH72_05340 [Candidatus Micrarchaeota archaeon]|nr:hypothetical protein [Candidatus Micrarchaeota archaeon]
MVAASRTREAGIIIRDLRAVSLVNAERDRTHMSETKGETIGRALLTLRTLEAHGIRVGNPEITGEPIEMISGILVGERWVIDLLKVMRGAGESYAETVISAFLKLQRLDETVQQKPRTIRAIGGIGPARSRSQTHVPNGTPTPLALEGLRSALSGETRN